MGVIVTNKHNGIAYEYMGNDTYKNLQTEQQGQIPKDKAKEVFFIDPILNHIADKNRVVKDLLTFLSTKSI